MRAQIDREDRSPSQERKSRAAIGRRCKARFASCVGAEMKPSVLVLSPPTAFATPRNWGAPPARAGRDGHPQNRGPLHWRRLAAPLAYCAQGAASAALPAASLIHGDLVVPTPQSCRAWAGAAAGDEYEWRQQAVMLGLDRSARRRAAAAGRDAAWLEPILLDAAAGRWSRLEADMLKYVRAGRTPGA